jgi:SAM-dependent methyltransferase
MGITEFLKRRTYAFEDWVFDMAHGVDFSGVVPADKLAAGNAESAAHATAYHAVWRRNLRVVFKEAARQGVVFANFVDVGCGKGKACIFAAKSTILNFDLIKGVDFSAALIEAAEANKRRAGAQSVVFEVADASEYRLAPGNTLTFLFNPFDEVVLSRFVANNREHFAAYASFVAYANDIHRDVLEREGFNATFREPGRHLSLFRYSRHDGRPETARLTCVKLS